MVLSTSDSRENQMFPLWMDIVLYMYLVDSSNLSQNPRCKIERVENAMLLASNHYYRHGRKKIWPRNFFGARPSGMNTFTSTLQYVLRSLKYKISDR